MDAIFILLLLLAVLFAIRFSWLMYRDSHTSINLNSIAGEDTMLSCAVFDGKEIWNNCTVVLKDGIISKESTFDHGEAESEYFLIPGLIDAHAHISHLYQMEQFVKSGVTAVCDVSAPDNLENAYPALRIWSSRSMIWLSTENVKSYVDGVLAAGGKYIKAVVDAPAIMGGSLIERSLLKEIVSYAHEKDLKVAVHATTIAAYDLAVDCGVDILIHIPIGEAFPDALAQNISDKKIAVIPTLVMMKAFADSPFYGYKKADYEDAKKAVMMLHSYGVPILVGTDANSSGLVPKVEHGISLDTEMKLLQEAGLPASDILMGATSRIAEAFGIENAGSISVGKKANMVLVKGAPNKDIANMEIVQIWVDGKPLLGDVK